MKKIVSLLVPLIGVVIFVLIIRGIGVRALLETFRSIDPVRLLVFPVFAVVVVWLRGARWRHLMKMIGIDYPLGRSMLIWTIGFAAAAVTPGKVGDAMRVYYLNKDIDRNLGECFLTVFIDRLLDFATVLLSGVVTILIFSYYYVDLPNIWVIVAAVAGMFGALYLVLNGKLLKRVMRPIFHLVAPDRYKAELSANFNSFYQPLGTYFRDWRQTSIAIAYTLTFWSVVVTLAYAVTWVMGIDVRFRYLLLIMPMMTLVEVLPISVAGIGTRDAAAIYFFSVVGVSSAQAVGFSLLYVVVGTYLLAAVGFVAWLLKPAKFNNALGERPSG